MAMTIYNALTDSENAQSRGISVPFPSKAAENASRAVKKYGADLNSHISRQLTLQDIEDYSLVITMTLSQKAMLLSMVKSDKIITLAEFAGEAGDVSDPYGGDEKLYEKTADMIFFYIQKALNKCNIAKKADIKEIAQLEKEYFADFWSESAINTQIELNQVVVYKEKGIVLGYCIFMTAADEGEILRICVNKENRKSGIGRKLLEYSIDIMRKRGACEIFLEVRASNREAISLYEKMEFVKIGVRKNYYENNEDAILYKKER